jgi:hypothetical protein
MKMKMNLNSIGKALWILAGVSILAVVEAEGGDDTAGGPVNGGSVSPQSTVNSTPVAVGSIQAIPAAIAAAQKANVPESWGTEAYQCFTEADYSAFKSNGSAARIAAKVIAKPEILAAIPVLRGMSKVQLAKTTAEWRRPLRKTWEQLGRISREGQTDAGQRAELDIAIGITAAVLGQLEK